MEAPADLVGFCRAEWSRLVGTLALVTGDAHLAEELAQETIVRVCRDWRKVSQLDAPGAWAHRVAVDLAHSHFRRRAVARRALARTVTSESHDPLGEIASVLAVRNAVMQLPRRERTALVLRYYRDFSVRTVAEIMRCPEGTVKTLTRKAIASLRAAGLLENEGEMGDLEESDAR
jgi:RNA polymerase sigma factor (sigma-70 family)